MPIHFSWIAPRRDLVKKLVLHPMWKSIRVFSSTPRCRQSQVRATDELVAAVFDNTSHEVWVLSAEKDQVIVDYVGFPHQRLPLSEFLTLPAVSSHLDRVVLFHTTSTHRILGLQSVSLSASRCTFSAPDPLLLLGQQWSEVVNHLTPLPLRSTALFQGFCYQAHIHLLLHYLRDRYQHHPFHQCSKLHRRDRREAN